MEKHDCFQSSGSKISLTRKYRVFLFVILLLFLFSFNFCFCFCLVFFLLFFVLFLFCFCFCFCYSFQFDIKDIYFSIKRILLYEALHFSKRYVIIEKNVVELIFYACKLGLYQERKVVGEKQEVMMRRKCMNLLPFIFLH